MKSNEQLEAGLGKDTDNPALIITRPIAELDRYCFSTLPIHLTLKRDCTCEHSLRRSYWRWPGQAWRPKIVMTDGDTFQLDRTIYRLDGIDAPEIDQMCLDQSGDVWPCGVAARDRLSAYIGSRAVRCDDKGPDPVYKHRRIGISIENDRLALALLLQTGHARADVVRMGRQHVRSGILSMRRQKTQVPFDITVLPVLQAEIEMLPKSDQLAFLLTEQGKPFTAAGFGNKFREWCNQATCATVRPTVSARPQPYAMP